MSDQQEQPHVTADRPPSGAPAGPLLDHAVTEELVALYDRQSMRTGPIIGVIAVLIGAAAWPHAPHWMVLAWVAVEWTTLAIRRAGLKLLPGRSMTTTHRLRAAQLLRGLHGLSNAASVMFFPYLTDLGRTMVTLILMGLATGAIGTSGGYLAVYLVYLGPVMGALVTGWALTPYGGEDAWLARAIVPLLILFTLVMVGLARDNFRAFKQTIAKSLDEELLNKQLQQALKAAEDANAAKTRFLAAASHDLRQPLQTLSMFFETLRLRDASAGSAGQASQRKDQPPLLDLINETLQDLQSQMDTLLDMSNLDAGTVTPEWRHLELLPLLQRIARSYEFIARQKGIVLKLDCPPDAFVRSDRDQLRRVIRNLIDNAVKYTSAGEVNITAFREGERVMVHVQDSGCGIAQEHQTQVFEEFFQVDNPERDHTRGRGLGLSIVERITNLLHIELRLRSTPGVGTTVTLTMQSGSPEEAESAATSALESRAPLPMCHVLLVDDQERVRDSIGALLQSIGCEVSLAGGIAEALAMAAENRPDLVLADLRLRGQQDGVMAVQALRNLHPGLPAIILTGDTAPDRLQIARVAQLPVLHKPASADGLMRAIAAALDAGD